MIFHQGPLLWVIHIGFIHFSPTATELSPELMMVSKVHNALDLPEAVTTSLFTKPLDFFFQVLSDLKLIIFDVFFRKQLKVNAEILS